MSASPSTSGAKSFREKRSSHLIVLWAILLTLTLAVFLLRFQRLSELPPGLYFDEGIHGADALQVLRGEHRVFFAHEDDGLEGMIAYTIALTTTFLGRTLLAVRLPTALASAGTVFVVFWLGQLLFGRDERGQSTPWRGLIVGGVGAGLMAVSIGQTIIGREALRANFLPLLLSLSLALLWWGWPRSAGISASSGAHVGAASADRNAGSKRRSVWWRIALAGVCAGLLPYSYIAARFTPFLFLFFGLSLLLPIGRCESDRKSIKGKSGPLISNGPRSNLTIFTTSFTRRCPSRNRRKPAPFTRLMKSRPSARRQTTTNCASIWMGPGLPTPLPPWVQAPGR